MWRQDILSLAMVTGIAKVFMTQMGHDSSKLDGRYQPDDGIKPYAWIVNQSFAGEGFRDPVLVERGSREAPYIAEVHDRLATRFTVIPCRPDAPVGPELLRKAGGPFTGLCRSFERLKTDMDTPTSPRLSEHCALRQQNR